MTLYSYKLENGNLSWVADIRLTGKPRHRKKNFRNKTEAKNYELKYLAKLKNNQAIVSNKLDLGTI